MTTPTIKFIDLETDPWRALPADDAEALKTPASYRIFTLAQWRQAEDRWPADLPKGLALSNDEDVEDIEAEVDKFQLVALDFPKWADGRAYSQAHILRARYRYTGEVRATGQALVDMMPMMLRSGFDTVVLRADQSREAAERALRFFPEFYQGDVHQPFPRFARHGAAAEQAATAEGPAR